MGATVLGLLLAVSLGSRWAIDRAAEKVDSQEVATQTAGTADPTREPADMQEAMDASVVSAPIMPVLPASASAVSAAVGASAPSDAVVAQEAGPPLGGSPAWKDSVAAAVLSQRHDFSDPAVRAAVTARLAAAARAEEAYTVAQAAALGYELNTSSGAVLVGFQGLEPVYEKPENSNAAISTAVDRIRLVAPYHLSGEGYTIGLWEAGGLPYAEHGEFDGRVELVDSGTTSSHATHVAGTLVARGLNAGLMGMAPRAKVRAYTSTSDTAEMAAVAMASPREPGMIQISNHSYGTLAGWEDVTDAGDVERVVWYGTFSDDANGSNDYPHAFGRYDTSSAAWDGVHWNAPYFLAFNSAGNHRNDNAPAYNSEWRHNSANAGLASRYVYAVFHPASDGDYRFGRYGTNGSFSQPGFDVITNKAGAKNNVTVGAVNDAVAAGQRNLDNATFSNFSSFGPTDDGRIKPDLVANGVSLTSTGTTSPTATRSSSGTSMASPNAAGSALLLVELFERDRPGQSMLGSTLKALLLHTADDLGVAGPDYQYGWGLLNAQVAADLILADLASNQRGRLWEGLLLEAEPVAAVPLVVPGGGPLRVTMTWTDPPGPTVSGSQHNVREPRLVHDLNLRVVGPTGTVHLPWTMAFPDDPESAFALMAPAAPGVNRVDNTEQVWIGATAAGLYRIEIDVAGALTQGDQRYSLVVTGGEVPQGFSRWAWEEQGEAPADDPAEAFTAAPGGGLPLGARYALSAAAPTVQVVGEGAASLLYGVDLSRPDVEVLPEWSADLGEWQILPAVIEGTSGTVEQRRAQAPQAGPGFFRLQVRLSAAGG